MFHFPAFPPHTLCVQVWVTRHDSGWVSPFGNPGIIAWLTAPPGLSRPPTSFIGSWCQGIHRMPLKTCLQRCSHPLCSSQRTNGHPPFSATAWHRLSSGRFGGCESPDSSSSERNTRVFSQDPTACRQTCETPVMPFHVLADRTNHHNDQAECI